MVFTTRSARYFMQRFSHTSAVFGLDAKVCLLIQETSKTVFTLPTVDF